MAKSRMFNLQIIDSDDFLEMPLTAQALYFHISMRSDDDGFCNKVRVIMNTIGASEIDLKFLIAKRYLICFGDNSEKVYVVTHWNVNNHIAGDKYRTTTWMEQLCFLISSEDMGYIPRNDYYNDELNAINCKTIKRYKKGTKKVPKKVPELVPREVPQTRLDQTRLDQTRIGKTSPDQTSNTIPSLQEVIDYIDSNNLQIYAADFLNHYKNQGWMCDGKPIKDWRKLIKIWAKNEKNRKPGTEREYDWEQLEQDLIDK